MKTEKNIFIAFLLNLCFSLFELVGGFLTSSVAIVSDAIHDFGDAVSIGLSYFLEKKSKKKPDELYTYGYVRYSILGAFITSTILIIGSIGVSYVAIIRLFNPTSINYDGMILFAVIGVIVNFFAVYFTRKGSSLNEKAVNLHMLEDVFNWIIVLIGSVIMKFTNIKIIDLIMTLGISIFLFYHACKNIKSILDLFLEKVPNSINISELESKLLQIKGVKQVHHIHVWSIDGIHNYATMHVVTREKDCSNIKKEIRKELEEDNIFHVTIEFETEKEICNEKCCHIKEAKCSHHHNHH